MTTLANLEAIGGASADAAVPRRSFSTHPKRRPRLTRARRDALHASETAITARLQSTLHRSEAHLALVSRAGSDLSRFRFDGEAPAYTHTGFVTRERTGWRVFQLLNTHGGAEGHLYRQSLVDFFRDDPHEYRCAVLVPSAGLQARIAEVLRSPLAERLYTPRYNRVAYPLSTRYQNSNQWVAEVIGAAQSRRRSRRAVQDYLAARGLRPTVLRTFGYLVQAAIAAVARNTRFDDHPLAARLAGRIAFVTETSLREYLDRTDHVALSETIRLEPPRPPELPGVPAYAA